MGISLEGILRGVKKNQGKKLSISFANTTNNATIYCSYLMNTSGDSTKEEEEL